MSPTQDQQDTISEGDPQNAQWELRSLPSQGLPIAPQRRLFPTGRIPFLPTSKSNFLFFLNIPKLQSFANIIQWVEIILHTGPTDKVEKMNAQTPAKRSLAEGVESEGKKRRVKNMILMLMMFIWKVQNKNNQNGSRDQPTTL